MLGYVHAKHCTPTPEYNVLSESESINIQQEEFKANTQKDV